MADDLTRTEFELLDYIDELEARVSELEDEIDRQCCGWRAEWMPPSWGSCYLRNGHKSPHVGPSNVWEATDD